MDYKDKIKEILKDKTIPEEQRKKLEEILLTAEISEDERIRKKLIEAVKGDMVVGGTKDKQLAITWLEKQEQKPVKDTDEDIVEAVKDTSILDMVEPKFKVGNWYQCTKDFFGKGVTFDKNTAYYCAKEGCLQNEHGCHIAIVKDLYDNFKLWTIQDARDGDILTGKIDGDSYILIFKQVKDGWAETYGHYYDSVDRFCVPSQLFCRDYQGTFIPATKEQRDLLFQKMKEAGYEWDDKEKKLIKSEAICMYSTENYTDKERETLCEGCKVSCKYNHNTWSEEDENNLTDTCVAIRKFYHRNNGAQDLIDWLKSLKEIMKGEKA